MEWSIAELCNPKLYTIQMCSGIILSVLAIILMTLGIDNIMHKIFGRKSPKSRHLGSKPIANLKNINETLMELHYAVSNSFENQKMIQRSSEIIKKFPNAINKSLPPNGYTPFLKACLIGCEEIITLMLELGADVNTYNIKGDGPFYLSVFAIITKQIQDFSILNILINAGCPVNKPKYNGYTALHLAARCGHQQMVKWLLLNGANPHPLTSPLSPFQIAKKYGHDGTASLLLINLGITDCESNTSA